MALTADRVLRSSIELLRANPYGFLVTRSRGPQVHARLVQHLEVDADGGVWIGTSVRSRKAAEVLAEPVVTYAVEDRARFAYVAACGSASVVDDDLTRVSKWRPGLATFFPGGPEGDDFVLLHVRSTRFELMNFAEKIHPEPYGLVPAVIALDGDRWEVVPAERSS